MREPTKRCQFCDSRMATNKMQCPSCMMLQGGVQISQKDETVLLKDVSESTETRIETGPWDKAFSGGMLAGRVWLIGGGPGAGKSTLMLQLCNAFIKQFQKETLYIAAEETGGQIRSRAVRLEAPFLLDRLRLLPIGANGDIGEMLVRHKPCFAVVDSVSKLTKDLEEQAEIIDRLKTYAITLGIPVFVVAHISKESDFAGIMKLQHNPDALFTFFSADDGTRTLFVEKNRDGQAQIRMAFGMTEKGLFSMLCNVCKENVYMCTCA